MHVIIGFSWQSWPMRWRLIHTGQMFKPQRVQWHPGRHKWQHQDVSWAETYLIASSNFAQKGSAWPIRPYPLRSRTSRWTVGLCRHIFEDILRLSRCGEGAVRFSHTPEVELRWARRPGNVQKLYSRGRQTSRATNARSVGIRASKRDLQKSISQWVKSIPTEKYLKSWRFHCYWGKLRMTLAREMQQSLFWTNLY